MLIIQHIVERYQFKGYNRSNLENVGKLTQERVEYRWRITKGIKKEKSCIKQYGAWLMI